VGRVARVFAANGSRPPHGTSPAPAPLEDPLTYPGRIPAISYLLGPDGRPLPLELPAGMELAAAGVAAGSPGNTLAAVLRTLGAAPLHARHPVLAVGSNAAPAQLLRKLQPGGGSTVVPVVRATVGRLGVAPSAHLSRHGYVPAAPAIRPALRPPPSGERPGTAPESPAPTPHVTLLDEEQLRRIDATEPNYLRMRLDARAHPVRLGSGEAIRCDVYVSRHGVIVDDRAVGGTGAGPGRATLPPQPVLLARLLHAVPELGEAGVRTPEQLVARVRDATLDPVWVTRLISRHLRIAAAPPDRLPRA
jgi:hypothetical protein